VRIAGGTWTLWLVAGCCLVTVLVPGLGWVAVLGLIAALVLFRGAGEWFGSLPKADRWALGLFMLSATMGLVTAYDPASALRKYYVLAASCLLFLAVSSLPKRSGILLINGSIAIGVLLSVYFILSGDWQRWPADFELIDRIASRWQAFRPDLSLPPIHPNFVGGALAMLLPIPLFNLVGLVIRREVTRAVPLSLAGLLMAATLILTSSRGAWAALAAGLIVVCAVLLLRRPAGRPWPWPRIAVLALLVGGVASLAGRSLPAVLSSGVAETNRFTLFANSFQLVRDFAFTGGGLSSFPGLYSRYVLVIPDLFLEYSHNLYLDLLIEQGLLGLLAVSMLFLLSLLRILRFTWQGRETGEAKWLGLGLLAGSLVILLHGFIDDPLYGKSGSPLLFLIPAEVNFLTAAITQPADKRHDRLPFSARKWAVGAAFLLLGMVLMSGNAISSSFLANIGAVRMAKVELRGWPDGFRWGEQVQVAASAVPELVRALALDPEQATASYRLGLIDLAAGEYDAAVDRLLVAHDRRPSHRGVTKTLGYAELWRGDIGAGVQLLRTIPESTQELGVYEWWWGEQGQLELADRASIALDELEAGR
jgi:O-antigen ligase